jgi:predicted nucleotidyltransferase
LNAPAIALNPRPLLTKPKSMSPQVQQALDSAVDTLRATLGENLYSCCVYGSVVRGDAIEGISDINLLIILNQSSREAHEAIAQVINQQPEIDPFILAKRGFERSVRAFAPKFASIQRHYCVLFGADPLTTFRVDPPLEKFLCEQALRNLRLRLVYSFVTRHRHKAYDRFVVRSLPSLFIQLSEVLRLHGVTIPTEFEARIPIFEREFEISGEVLRELLELKKSPTRLAESQVVKLHERLFAILDSVVLWIETHWPA